MGIAFRVANGNKSYASWSYSGFKVFRERLAEAIGITLNQMEGFHNVDSKIIREQGWDAYVKAMNDDLSRDDKISWDSIDNPLVPFLNHSDCDGHLSDEICGAIADQIEKIISDWNPLDYDRKQGELLCEALRDAAKSKKPLIFS